MALISALMFLYLKLKGLVIYKEKNQNLFLVLFSFFIGFLSLSIMYYPLVYEGMLLDLREMPLFFISYIGGWKLGVISAIIPGAFRFSLGGPTLIQGVFQTILLPVLIGAIFHNKKLFKPPLYNH